MEVSNDATATSEGEEDEDQAGGDGKDDDPLAEGTAVGDEQLPTGPRGPAHVVAVDETSDNDAVRALQVAQRQMQLLQEEAERVAREEEKRNQEDKGGRLECSRIAVSLQQVLRRMGTRKAQLEFEHAARRADERCPVEMEALAVPTNEPLSLFAARTRPASLVEFFYGDCAPFLDSEVPLSCEEVFASLLVREELEYSLPEDEVPYKASQQNRWSTPEIVALFADVRRRLATLAGARATFRRQGFTELVKKVAGAQAADFVQAATLVRSTGGPRPLWLGVPLVFRAGVWVLRARVRGFRGGV